ncbi:hypothetical protein [Desertibacillus haloalkaliphilus]|uniref:hypothetical protein n=1 Tax=Desertibacillus haloalkaliphilus TaxID=1328930 RepID=UPI001C257052|nr:hypothetical protein [Desertibacillus haloalkaliphilus]MBU8905605.1 hypothetical protein [Desertibacillus haloalkaliphilus]
MLMKKGFVSLSIFFVLFASAWWLHNINERNIEMLRYNEAEQNDFGILGVQEDDYRPVGPFLPREYIRINERVHYVE